MLLLLLLMLLLPSEPSRGSSSSGLSITVVHNLKYVKIADMRRKSNKNRCVNMTSDPASGIKAVIGAVNELVGKGVRELAAIKNCSTSIGREKRSVRGLAGDISRNPIEPRGAFAQLFQSPGCVSACVLQHLS